MRPSVTDFEQTTAIEGLRASAQRTLPAQKVPLSRALTDVTPSVPFDRSVCLKKELNVRLWPNSAVYLSLADCRAEKIIDCLDRLLSAQAV